MLSELKRQVLMEAESTEKRVWNDPELIVFGDIETLTLAQNKNFGTGDAYTFQNQSTRLSG